MLGEYLVASEAVALGRGAENAGRGDIQFQRKDLRENLPFRFHFKMIHFLHTIGSLRTLTT